MLFNIIYDKNKILMELSCTEEDAQAQGYSYIESNIPQEEIKHHYIKNGVITLLPSNPYSYGVFNYDLELWEHDTETATYEVLNKRNQLLTESDWISYRAYETNTPIPQVWLDYRQALRDITLQVGYPLDVVWPTPPGA